MKAVVIISMNNADSIVKAGEFGTTVGGNKCDLLITSYDSFGIHAVLTSHVGGFETELEAEGWAADHAEETLREAYQSICPRSEWPITYATADVIELN